MSGVIASTCLVLYLGSAFLGSFLVSEQRSISTDIEVFGNVVRLSWVFDIFLNRNLNQGENWEIKL